MKKLAILLALVIPAAGCVSEDVLRYDGVTTASGDAIAANTVMQMVDPWPRGVEDTRLRTPAVRPESRDSASTKEASK